MTKRMKYRVGSILVSSSLLLGACNNDSGTGQTGEMALESYQYYTPIASMSDTVIERAVDDCHKSTEPIRLSKSGSSVFVRYWNDTAEFQFEENYEIVSDEGFPLGTWKWKGNRVYKTKYADAVSVAKADSLSKRDAFVFAGETVRIKRDRIEYYYPHFFLFEISDMAYRNKNRSDFALKFIGADSAEIQSGDLIAGIKYIPFNFFRATASKDYPAINLTLDACETALSKLSDSWIYDL